MLIKGYRCGNYRRESKLEIFSELLLIFSFLKAKIQSVSANEGDFSEWPLQSYFKAGEDLQQITDRVLHLDLFSQTSIIVVFKVWAMVTACHMGRF